MGFSSQQYRKQRQERRWKIHPAWQGIGCILCLIIPIMSWVGATLVLENNLLPLSNTLTKVFSLPYTHIRAIDQVVLQLNQYFSAVKFQTGQVFLTVIFLFIGFGILALIYAILYKIAGPPRYGPFDVPPNSERW
jgi:hypothetical protein